MGVGIRRTKKIDLPEKKQNEEGKDGRNAGGAHVRRDGTEMGFRGSTV